MSHIRRRTLQSVLAASAVLLCLATTSWAQSVCLPSPRLLTTMPMGGQAGTEFELLISGEYIEDVEQLLFSHPAITATAKLATDGTPVPNTFVINIAPDCPLGIHEARVMSRLGISSARVFTVGTLTEVKQDQPATSVEAALSLALNSVCNAVLPPSAVNHYKFEAKQGQRIVIDCAANGIDSKMKPVLVVADAAGLDLVAERRGGVIDFTVPSDGTYVIKVHDLTFKGGPDFYYRLCLQELAAGDPITRLPSTRSVSSFSWPPAGLADDAALKEVEPNNSVEQVQRITLPCDIAGSFYPAADVDIFEFTASKGDVWWVEIASERLGRSTDPAAVVQQVVGSGADTKLVDLVELSDIASPVKRSSNGYAYDGPPYNAGSTDFLGTFEIKEDGVYRLQVSDLFGGTRNEPDNIYRLIIRKAEPDFAIVAWPLHMELRNGDRAALSKPLALRGGSTVALEVVTVRRDGFDGEIQLAMENLPDGVQATGLRIPAGQSRGIMLVTAREDAPRGMTLSSFYGRAVIDGKEVIRPCHTADVAWPIPDSWGEIPAPRLLSQCPVSVGGSEVAALTIAPQENKVWEVTEGQKLTIPLTHTRRSEFSGSVMGLRVFGAGLEHTPRWEVSLTADSSEAVFDLAQLKTPPGDYLIALYGSAVAQYRFNPAAIVAAELALQQAQQTVEQLDEQLAQINQQTSTATEQQKAELEISAQAVAAKKQAAEAALTAATQRLQQAKAQAQPKDIVDIIVSEPIAIRINAAETK